MAEHDDYDEYDIEVETADDDEEREIINLDAPGIVEANCEFCDRRYWVDSNKCTAMHELPGCAMFDALDALSFVVENNKAKTKKLKNRAQA